MRLDTSTARMGIPTVRVSGVRKCTVAMISCVTCVAGRGRNWNGVMFWQMLDRGPGWQSAGRVIFRFEESQRERDRSIAKQSLGHNHRDNIIGTTALGTPARVFVTAHGSSSSSSSDKHGPMSGPQVDLTRLITRG